MSAHGHSRTAVPGATARTTPSTAKTAASASYTGLSRCRPGRAARLRSSVRSATTPTTGSITYEPTQGYGMPPSVYVDQYQIVATRSSAVTAVKPAR